MTGEPKPPFRLNIYDNDNYQAFAVRSMRQLHPQRHMPGVEKVFPLSPGLLKTPKLTTPEILNLVAHGAWA